MDADAAEGLITGGLFAKLFSRRENHGPGDYDRPRVCSDCGAAVTGKFCAECGQPAHVHRSLLHLVEEVLHGVIHFDGRIWRTLPLLAFNPGRLTREWVQGRRTRYVSPLAMFLFTVFLMFFAFSLGGGSDTRTPAQNIDQRIAQEEQALVQARAELAQVREKLNLAVGAPGKAYTDAGERVAVATIEAELTRLRQEKAAGRTTSYTGSGWMAEMSEQARNGELKPNTGNKALDKILIKKAMNPELAIYKIQQTAYKFSFLLVPLSIPFVALLFLWRRGSTFYDHGVFVLYSLTAMSILFTVALTLPRLWTGFGIVTALLTSFGPPAHMFAQLKGAYGLSIFSALWRTAALLIFSFMASLLFLAAIVSMGFTS